VTFNPDEDGIRLQQRLDESRSKLMTFFDYNRDHEDGRHLLYQQFPTYYVYKNQERAWQPRQRGTAVGRIYRCDPRQGERFWLRLLLITVPGPTSFEYLRTYQRVTYDTFKETCVARGLVEDDNHWIRCFKESVVFLHGARLRALFVIALTHGDVINPGAIWERFRAEFSDDLPPRLRQLHSVPEMEFPKQDYTLYLIEQSLIEQRETLAQYSLPAPIHDWQHDRLNPIIGHELDYNTAVEQHRRDETYERMNEDQRRCFDIIIAAVE
jgi:hypothetical protein